MSDLATLVAKDAIRDLVQRYSRAIDRYDYAGVRALYVPGAIDDHGVWFSGPVEGYVDWLETVNPGVERMTHLVTNHLISVAGDAAEGEVYVVAYHRFLNDDGTRRELVKGMRYLDRYAVHEGGWRFAARKVIEDWDQEGPALWQGAVPGAPADDASHSFLKSALFARTPA